VIINQKINDDSILMLRSSLAASFMGEQNRGSELRSLFVLVCASLSHTVIRHELGTTQSAPHGARLWNQNTTSPSWGQTTEHNRVLYPPSDKVLSPEPWLIIK